jgi:hypothetical protein
MTELATMIAAIATLIAAGGGVVIGIRNSRKAEAAALAAAIAETAAKASRVEIMLVGDKVVQVGEQLDGRLSQLLTEARALARAEGRAEGEQAQRDRAAEAQP